MNDNTKAKDILNTLTLRKVVGDRVGRRVSARGMEAPVFAKGRKIFEKLGLPDPWDPSAPKDISLELGDIGLPQHRAPTPHLMPKEAPKAGPKIPSIPGMPTPTPKEPGGRPAPTIGEMRKDDTEELRRKMKEKERQATEALRQARVAAQPQQPQTPVAPLARLPVRPDLDQALSKKAPTNAPARPAAPSGGGAPLRPPPRPPEPARSGRVGPARLSMDSSRRMPDVLEVRELPETPAPVAEVAPPMPETEEVAVEIPPPPPVVQNSDVADMFGTGGGSWNVRRFETPTPTPAVAPEVVAAPVPAPVPVPEVIKPVPTPVTTPVPTPVSVPIPVPAPAPRGPMSEIGAPARSTHSEIGARPQRPPVAVAAPEAPVAPAQPPPRPSVPAAPVSRKPPSGGGDMNDLFGGGAETRVRMPKASDANKPRRPMVSTPEELAKQALDRRPPSVRPPDIKISTGGGPDEDAPD